MALFSGSSQRRLAMWQIGEAQKERERNDALIAEARGQALNEIGSGVDQAVPYYTGAIDRFQPWVQSGLDAVGQYNTTLGSIGAANDQYRARLDDIYGYGGADGTARVNAAFVNSPGYQKQRDEAIDAAMRAQSAGGMLGSGNTIAAVQDRAADVANKDYWNWVNGQNTGHNIWLQGAQTQLSGYGNLAQLGANATGQQAQLERGIGDLYAGAGAQKGNVWMQGAGLNVGSNNNYLNSISQSAQTAGRAGQDALANNLNFGLGAASTLLSGLGTAKKVGLF